MKNRILLLGAVAVLLGLSIPGGAAAQTKVARSQRVTDIDAVTVRSKALTYRQILDSVRKHLPKNHPPVPALYGRLSAGFYNSGSDSVIIKRESPVYLFDRGRAWDDPMKVFPVLDSIAAVGDLARGDEDTRLRYVTISKLPPTSSIAANVIGLAKRTNPSRTFWGVSKAADSTKLYHIIVLEKKFRLNLLGDLLTNVPQDSTIAWNRLTVRADNWAVVSQESAAAIGGPALRAALRAAKGYGTVTGALDSLLADGRVRRVRSGYTLRRDGAYGYVPENSFWEDNLLNFSHNLFSRAANPERTLYRFAFSINGVCGIPEKNLDELYSIVFQLPID